MIETLTPAYRKAGPPDPEFGELLTERGTSWIYWILVLVLCALTLVAAAVVFGGLRLRFFPPQPIVSPRPGGVAPGSAAPSSDWLPMVGYGLLFTALFGGLTYLLIRQLFTKARFYETGVRLVTLGKPRRSMAYADCERFWFHTVRQYVNGIYAGTTVTITLKAKGRRTVKWSGRHKEKPKGFAFTILGKREFKGEDELDVVKLIIADAMADRWIDRLTAGTPVDWNGRLELSAVTATPRRGKRKGQAIAYADIDRFSVKDGTLHLFHTGDEKPFITVACGDTNFYPGMRVLERMWSLAAPLEPEA